MTPVNTLTDQIIADEGQTIVQTYRRAPFVLVHGEGMNLYDSEGNAYLDWGSGLAVNALGYGDAELNDVISRQMANGLIHVSNLYHTAPQVQLASALVEKSFADRVFFCNSGTEANEAALKFARKLARTQGGEGKHELVTFTGGFHGRTMGALALTPRDKYQQPFAPMMPGVRVAEFNNLESAKAAIGPNTAAVFVEPVQGEGGVNVADADFIKGLRALCDEFGAALVFDEIQCGMGRTGTLWAYEQFGVTPDIMTLAKPLAAGLPIGAVLVTERVGSVMEPGDHGSTFAGGPLVTAVAAHVVERVSSADFLTQVQETGTYLLERLQEINSPLIETVRGMGLMAGVELNVEAGPFIARGYEQGLIMLNAGPNVLRFLPPLIAEKSHVDTLIDRLVPLLQEAQVQA
jgi:predicted acetylornithine/succinylornithine family transaminase